MKKFRGKNDSKQSIRLTQKKERIESKVWVTFKKGFLKKSNYTIISLLKKKFSIGLVSRRSIFELKVLKEFVKTSLFNVRVRLT